MCSTCQPHSKGRLLVQNGGCEKPLDKILPKYFKSLQVFCHVTAMATFSDFFFQRLAGIFVFASNWNLYFKWIEDSLLYDQYGPASAFIDESPV